MPLTQEQQRQRLIDAARPSSHARGYDRAWAKLRARYLQQHPLCAACSEHGKATPATVVHHLTRISHQRHQRLNPANLQALCTTCHNRITATEDGFAKGNGYKVAPHHSWG